MTCSTRPVKGQYQAFITLIPHAAIGLVRRRCANVYWAITGRCYRANTKRHNGPVPARYLHVDWVSVHSRSIRVVNSQLQKEADSINSWCKEKRMKNNVEKNYKNMLLD